MGRHRSKVSDIPQNNADDKFVGKNGGKFYSDFLRAILYLR